MGPDETLSPALHKKVVHAAACSASFQQAEEDLRVLAEVEVSANRIHRAAQRVGQERIADFNAAAIAYQQLPLPEQQQSPGPAPPDLACIQTDGGRIQIRPRGAASNESDSWWRETKAGCLLAMTSDTHVEDPAPRVPEAFVDPARMAKISREIQGFFGEAADSESSQESESNSYAAPRVVRQTVVATTRNVERFGELLVAKAHALGFAGARRKAFLGDGSETNWGLWRRRFSHYTPILDWVHALCYVYAAAMAGINAAEGWAAYCSRMNYPEYRRQGLPITSSHIESTIKRINRRMKGTDKFLGRRG